MPENTNMPLMSTVDDSYTGVTALRKSGHTALHTMVTGLAYAVLAVALGIIFVSIMASSTVNGSGHGLTAFAAVFAVITGWWSAVAWKAYKSYRICVRKLHNLGAELDIDED